MNLQTGRKPMTVDQAKALLATIKVPTLVMHGEDDALIPVADGKALAGAIPGANLILYPATGHIPMEEKADQSALDLKAWLKLKGLG
jgi:pimeloyl-ACP methyl ester carboxylesterase